MAGETPIDVKEHNTGFLIYCQYVAMKLALHFCDEGIYCGDSIFFDDNQKQNI